MDKQLLLSSDIEKNNDLKGEEKVIEICKKLDGTEYYNAAGGRTLYNSQHFEEKGIQLRFLETQNICYKQYTREFIPNLSIIDIMMFNSIEEIKVLLQSCCLKK